VVEEVAVASRGGVSEAGHRRDQHVTTSMG
jgi:hypothetical protein